MFCFVPLVEEYNHTAFHRIISLSSWTQLSNMCVSLTTRGSLGCSPVARSFVGTCKLAQFHSVVRVGLRNLQSQKTGGNFCTVTTKFSTVTHVVIQFLSYHNVPQRRICFGEFSSQSKGSSISFFFYASSWWLLTRMSFSEPLRVNEMNLLSRARGLPGRIVRFSRSCHRIRFNVSLPSQ